MLRAAIEQYEERYPERKVKVMKDTQWYVRFVTTLREVPPDPPPTTAANGKMKGKVERTSVADLKALRSQRRPREPGKGGQMLSMRYRQIKK